MLLYVQHTLIFQQDIMQKQPQHVVYQTLKQLINFKINNGHNYQCQRKLIDQVKANADRDQIFYQSVQEKLKSYFEKNWNFLLKVCKSLDNALRKSMLKQVKIIDSFWKTSYEAFLTNIPQISFIQILKKMQEKVEERQKNQLNLKDYKNFFRDVARQNKFPYKDFDAFIQYIESFEQQYETINNQNPRNDMYQEQEELLNQFINNIQKCKKNEKDVDFSKKELEQQTSYSQNIQKSYFQNVYYDKSQVGSASSNILGMDDMLSEIQKKEQKQQKKSQNQSEFHTVHKNKVDQVKDYKNSNTYIIDYSGGNVKPSENKTKYDESVTKSQQVVINKTFNTKF